jgi:L-aminopeptidase/D-esterase-like protein
MAVAAHDGMARAMVPSHTPLDGDLVFAAATGTREMADPLTDGFQIGHAAATCLARAIARAVYLAAPMAGRPAAGLGRMARTSDSDNTSG